LKGVEIDYCLNCKGIWLDSGELELLIGNDEETKEFLSSFVVIDTLTTERKVKCPICSKKMEKILVGDENKVRIDKCKNNDGLWFDSGELEEVLKISKLGKNDDKILVLLRDIFGQKRS
ncbi:MAG: zf-TFIIB domain-containing protein, partial [Candidatus Cloacimonetes bacterium]|nr:zf-TFIIB domain-containing protein [Candidatus Cloacimonadota bacterium]